MALRGSSALLLFGALLPAAQAALTRFEAVEPHMGTLVRITLYAGGLQQARAAFAAAFARIHAIDRTLSDYLPDSESNRLCSSAWRAPIPVSGDLYRVLSAAIRVSRESGGAFDVTLGPLIRLWRTARKDRALPPPAAIAAARERTGYHKVTLLSGRRVRLEREGMLLDFGAIGKGYAASEALQTLARQGCKRALVAVSGDLALGDPPPGASGWRISIEGRRDPLLLRRCAISTSGDSAQFVEIGGIRYSHVVDPKTGLGLRSQRPITVRARHGIDADAYSTALSLMNDREVRSVARQKKLLVISPDSFDAQAGAGIP